MSDAASLSRIASLIGDPSRSRMLLALLGGQARTASELALDAEVSPSTASSHLARLTEAGLLQVVRQGRHRYFRLAGAEVAAVLETLLGAVAAPAARRTGPADAALRRARVCYDHLAGELAVEWLEAMRASGCLQAAIGQELALTEAGLAWCGNAGIDVAALRQARRPLCRGCLDWSERRDHLAGSLGAAVLQRLFALGHARRIADSRAVVIDAHGRRFLFPQA